MMKPTKKQQQQQQQQQQPREQAPGPASPSSSSSLSQPAWSQTSNAHASSSKSPEVASPKSESRRQTSPRAVSSVANGSTPSPPTSAAAYKGKGRQQQQSAAGSQGGGEINASGSPKQSKRVAANESSSPPSSAQNTRKVARTSNAPPSSSNVTKTSATSDSAASSSPQGSARPRKPSDHHQQQRARDSSRSPPSGTRARSQSPSTSRPISPQDAQGIRSPASPTSASSFGLSQTQSKSVQQSTSQSERNSCEGEDRGAQYSEATRTIAGAPIASTSPIEQSLEQTQSEDAPASVSDLPDAEPEEYVDELSRGDSSVDSQGEERELVISDGTREFTVRVPQTLLLTSTIARGAYHQCGTARRVKVYQLSGETWEDRGTGYCAGVYDEGQDEALLVARLEEHSIKIEGAMPDPRRPTNRVDPLLANGEGESEANPENGPFPYYLIVSQDLSTDAIMLKSRVVKEDVYQKQQETLVVWTEPDGTDMALSFQEAEGCLEVWEFIIEVQKHFHLNSVMQQEVLSDPPTPDPGSPSSADYGVTGLGMGGMAAMDSNSFALPDPSLGTISKIETMLKNAAAKGAALRERVAEWLARSGYIRKLVPVFHDAEDMEDLHSLHCLCSIMQTIIMMNDSMIIETILQDDMFFEVIGMFEYDPEFPELKASYREYILHTAKYKQVVPIEDPKVVVKIHQAYRLQYLKDVILARILDDAMFSVLNSWIFFHQVDIVNYCTGSDTFLPQLFAMCADDSDATQEQRHEGVFLLQHLCAIGKQIQLPARIALCKTLAEKGLLPVVEYGLFEKAQRVQNAAAEMLMILVEYDPNSVRNYIMEQVEAKQSTLISKVAALLHSTEDLGLKALMAEALRIIFDNSAENAPPNASLAAAAAAARTKGEPDKFLTWFYEADVEAVFSPLKRLERVNHLDDSTRLDLTPRHYSALLGHLCDLLCYTVAQHTFRSQYYVITSEIGAHVGSLLHAKEKHMRLAGIKFFRTCLASNNQFMNKHFVKQRIFDSLLALTERESHRDNLVLSACLELFETISAQNVHLIINHLAAEPCRKRVLALSENKYTGSCFQNLLSQAQSSPGTTPMKGSGQSAGSGTAKTTLATNAEGAEDASNTSFSSTSSSSLNSSSHEDLYSQEEQKRRQRDLAARGVYQMEAEEDEDEYFRDDDDDEEDTGTAEALVGVDTKQQPQKSTNVRLVPYADDENSNSTSSDPASPASSSPPPPSASPATTTTSASSSSDASGKPMEADVDAGPAALKLTSRRAGDDEDEYETSGGFLRNDDDSTSAPTPTAGVKRSGEPLSKPGSSVKKISLGLSSSSRKMAAASATTSAGAQQQQEQQQQQQSGDGDDGSSKGS